MLLKKNQIIVVPGFFKLQFRRIQIIRHCTFDGISIIKNPVGKLGEQYQQHNNLIKPMAYLSVPKISRHLIFLHLSSPFIVDNCSYISILSFAIT